MNDLTKILLNIAIIFPAIFLFNLIFIAPYRLYKRNRREISKLKRENDKLRQEIGRLKEERKVEERTPLENLNLSDLQKKTIMHLGDISSTEDLFSGTMDGIGLDYHNKDHVRKFNAALAQLKAEDILHYKSGTLFLTEKGELYHADLVNAMFNET